VVFDLVTIDRVLLFRPYLIAEVPQVLSTLETWLMDFVVLGHGFKSFLIEYKPPWFSYRMNIQQ
jgi:hypothetical protein